MLSRYHPVISLDTYILIIFKARYIYEKTI